MWVDRRAAAPRNPKPPRYQVTNIQITIYNGRSANRVLGAGLAPPPQRVFLSAERPEGEARSIIKYTPEMSL